MKENNYFHCCLLPMNGLQYRKTYSGRPVGNNPKFMPFDHILNRDILHSLRFHCILRHFVLYGKGTDKGERNIYFSFSTPKEIARGLKRKRESKMGTPFSVKITEDVDLGLKELEIFYHANWAAVRVWMIEMDTYGKW